MMNYIKRHPIVISITLIEIFLLGISLTVALASGINRSLPPVIPTRIMDYYSLFLPVVTLLIHIIFIQYIGTKTLLKWILLVSFLIFSFYILLLGAGLVSLLLILLAGSFFIAIYFSFVQDRLNFLWIALLILILPSLSLFIG